MSTTIDLATLGAERWIRAAACVEHERDADLRFSFDPADIARAVAVCDGCLVRDECLAYATTNRISDGIWGARTTRERRAMSRTPGRT